MFEIVVAICLLADPAKCKDVHLSYAAEGAAMTAHACMMYGQAEIAKWAEGHPGWQVKRWACGRPSLMAKA